MTATTPTTDQNHAWTGPALPPCPDWCEYNAPDHGWNAETTGGGFARDHIIDLGSVEASQDDVSESGQRPDAFVCLVQRETVNCDGGDLKRDGFRVAVATDLYPHLTAGEAREVAAMLSAAAGKLEALQDSVVDGIEAAL